MSGVHDVEFEKKRPILVHLDAPAAFRRDRVVVSYDWANDRDYLVIKLALIDGSTDTLVLRRNVAERLQELVQRLARKSWSSGSSASEAAPAKTAAKAPPPRKAAAAAHRPATSARRPKPAAKPAAKSKAKGRR
jgi:hypothetical protein